MLSCGSTLLNVAKKVFYLTKSKETLGTKKKVRRMRQNMTEVVVATPSVMMMMTAIMTTVAIAMEI